MPDTCPKTGYKHVPDWERLVLEPDGRAIYLDIWCADCLQSGTVGEIKTLEETITWEA